MLGHYSAGFTLDTYAHVTTSAQRQAAEAMEHVLSGSLKPFQPEKTVSVRIWFRFRSQK